MSSQPPPAEVGRGASARPVSPSWKASADGRSDLAGAAASANSPETRRCRSPTGIFMELNNDDAHDQQSEGGDRLSALPDDVLLCILGEVDLRTVVRTSVLSTRWRQLPWLLPKLDIDVEDFISDQHSKPIEGNVIHDAMLTTTAATKSLFAKPRRQSIVASLQLTLYLIDTFSSDIGPLVCDAIDSGLLKDLDLEILDEKEPCDCSDMYILQHAKAVDSFFNAHPSLFHCIRSLFLCNVWFLDLDMDRLLFECCTQLKHLSLFNCDAGIQSIWKIDAPNSKLSTLQLDTCSFERIELACLPKLENLLWSNWISKDVPLSFGFIPSLGELHLLSFSELDKNVFKLSDLLHGTTGIHTITLGFKGENLWMQPEMKQLSYAFSKLRKLSILGIFVEFDLVWTMALLVAAPFVEILKIQVWEHACNLDGENRLQTFPERRTPQWEMDFCSPKNLLLHELRIICFRPLKQQLTFIRAVLERAPNLQKIILRDESCEKCDALELPPRSSIECVFPKNKDEQETIVRRVTDGVVFLGQVIFDDCKKL